MQDHFNHFASGKPYESRWAYGIHLRFFKDLLDISRMVFVLGYLYQLSSYLFRQACGNQVSGGIYGGTRRRQGEWRQIRLTSQFLSCSSLLVISSSLLIISIYSKEIPVNIRVSSLPVPKAGLENFRYKELNAMTQVLTLQLYLQPCSASGLRALGRSIARVLRFVLHF